MENNKSELDLLLKNINLNGIKQGFSMDEIFSNMLNDALDGFLIILTSDGNVLFVTDRIQDFLGIQKV